MSRYDYQYGGHRIEDEEYQEIGPARAFIDVKAVRGPRYGDGIVIEISHYDSLDRPLNVDVFFLARCGASPAALLRHARQVALALGIRDVTGTSDFGLSAHPKLPYRGPKWRAAVEAAKAADK